MTLIIRKVSLLLCVLIAPACFFPPDTKAAEKLAGPIPAQVIRIIDGDTLDVTVHPWLGLSVKTRVRIANIDTPEMRGKCAKETEAAKHAHAQLQEWILYNEVELFDVRNGKYAGRVVARVQTKAGWDIGNAMIKEKLARKYNGRGKRQSWCDLKARQLSRPQ